MLSRISSLTVILSLVDEFSPHFFVILLMTTSVRLLAYNPVFTTMVVNETMTLTLLNRVTKLPVCV